MPYRKLFLGGCAVLVLVGIGCYLFNNTQPHSDPLDPTPHNITLTGTYLCLPHLDTSGPQTEECAFGLKTDEGVYYAVNFGQSENAMELFRSGARITAEGSVVIKEALSTDQWAKYNMKGIFTITKMIHSAPAEGKLDINAICEGALAYMTFPDGKSAATFVRECKKGMHPEVIEHYKEQMNLGAGAAI